MKILQEIWKQNLRPRAVVGYGVKIFLPSPPNYVIRSLVGVFGCVCVCVLCLDVFDPIYLFVIAVISSFL